MPPSRLTWIFEDRPMFSGQQGALGRLVPALEVIADVLHLDPPHTLLGADVLDQPITSLSTYTSQENPPLPDRV